MSSRVPQGAGSLQGGWGPSELGEGPLWTDAGALRLPRDAHQSRIRRPALSTTHRFPWGIRAGA